MPKQKLAAALGVRLGAVISYYENEVVPGEFYPVMYDKASGMGGAAPAAVSSGSKDVNMNVSVVYEILQ